MDLVWLKKCCTQIIIVLSRKKLSKINRKMGDSAFQIPISSENWRFLGIRKRWMSEPKNITSFWREIRFILLCSAFSIIFATLPSNFCCGCCGCDFWMFPLNSSFSTFSSWPELLPFRPPLSFCPLSVYHNQKG